MGEEAQKKAEEAMSKMGKDVMEGMKPKEAHEANEASAPAGNLENLETMTENMNLTEEQKTDLKQGARPKVTKNLGEEAPQDSDDPEWTVLDKSPPTPKASAP